MRFYNSVGHIHLLDDPQSSGACPSLRRTGLFLLSGRLSPAIRTAQAFPSFCSCLSVPLSEKPFLISLHSLVGNHFTFLPVTVFLRTHLHYVCMCFSLLAYCVSPSKIYTSRRQGFFSACSSLNPQCADSRHSEGSASHLVSLAPVALLYSSSELPSEGFPKTPICFSPFRDTLRPHNEVQSVGGGTAPGERPAKSQHPPHPHRSPRRPRSAAAWETPGGHPQIPHPQSYEQSKMSIVSCWVWEYLLAIGH